MYIFKQEVNLHVPLGP